MASGRIDIVLIELASYQQRQAGPGGHLEFTFVELGSGWILISGIGLVALTRSSNFTWWPQLSDWPYLLVLALVCTTLGYVLQLKALRHLSAFVSNLTMNLEPVYGIILAYLLLQENKTLSPKFYVGVLLILAAIFIYPFMRKKNNAPGI